MTRCHKRGKPEKGFTLVELLATLAIVAVLMGLVVPKISALFPNEEEEVVTRIRHAIIRARWAAARDQVPVRVAFDLRKQEIVVSEKGKEREVALLVLKIPSSVKMTGFWTKKAKETNILMLRFFPDGRGEGFGVFLEKGDSRWTVMGYPFRPGVEIVRGWVKGPPDARG